MDNSCNSASVSILDSVGFLWSKAEKTQILESYLWVLSWEVNELVLLVVEIELCIFIRKVPSVNVIEAFGLDVEGKDVDIHVVSHSIIFLTSWWKSSEFANLMERKISVHLEPGNFLGVLDQKWMLSVAFLSEFTLQTEMKHSAELIRNFCLVILMGLRVISCVWFGVWEGIGWISWSSIRSTKWSISSWASHSWRLTDVGSCVGIMEKSAVSLGKVSAICTKFAWFGSSVHWYFNNSQIKSHKYWT